MRPTAANTVFLCSLSLLSGCAAFKKLPSSEAKVGQSSALHSASAKVDAATAKEDDAAKVENAKTDEVLSKVKANVVSARAANRGNPEGAPRVKVEGELSVAESRLQNVTADPVELAAAAQRDLLVEQGKANEARAAYERANADAKGQAAELAKSRAEVEQARLDRDAARAQEKAALASFEQKLEQNRLANERLIGDLKATHARQLEDARNEVMREQVRNLNIAGAVCMALFALGLGFGGVTGLRMTWPFGLLGLLAFGLAQLVGQWWFMWACVVVVAAAVAAAVWWVWRHYKLGTLQQDARKKADTVHSVLTQVVPVLDKAYDNADESFRSLLNQTVFEPLSRKMNREEKATVHQLRSTVISQPGKPNP